MATSRENNIKLQLTTSKDDFVNDGNLAGLDNKNNDVNEKNNIKISFGDSEDDSAANEDLINFDNENSINEKEDEEYKIFETKEIENNFVINQKTDSEIKIINLQNEIYNLIGYDPIGNAVCNYEDFVYSIHNIVNNCTNEKVLKRLFEFFEKSTKEEITDILKSDEFNERIENLSALEDIYKLTCTDNNNNNEEGTNNFIKLANKGYNEIFLESLNNRLNNINTVSNDEEAIENKINYINEYLCAFYKSLYQKNRKFFEISTKDTNTEKFIENIENIVDNINGIINERNFSEEKLNQIIENIKKINFEENSRKICNKFNEFYEYYSQEIFKQEEDNVLDNIDINSDDIGDKLKNNFGDNNHYEYENIIDFSQLYRSVFENIEDIKKNNKDYSETKEEEIKKRTYSMIKDILNNKCFLKDGSINLSKVRDVSKFTEPNNSGFIESVSTKYNESITRKENPEEIFKFADSLSKLTENISGGDCSKMDSLIPVIQINNLGKVTKGNLFDKLKNLLQNNVKDSNMSIFEKKRENKIIEQTIISLQAQNVTGKLEITIIDNNLYFGTPKAKLKDPTINNYNTNKNDIKNNEYDIDKDNIKNNEYDIGEENNKKNKYNIENKKNNIYSISKKSHVENLSESKKGQQINFSI